MIDILICGEKCIIKKISEDKERDIIFTSETMFNNSKSPIDFTDWLVCNEQANILLSLMEKPLLKKDMVEFNKLVDEYSNCLITKEILKRRIEVEFEKKLI